MAAAEEVAEEVASTTAPTGMAAAVVVEADTIMTAMEEVMVVIATEATGMVEVVAMIDEDLPRINMVDSSSSSNLLSICHRI